MKQPLEIYLNDHLGGSTFGVNLARRTAEENRGTPFGPQLERIADEIAEDRRELVAIMAALRVPQSSAKVAVAQVAERIGRLKPNGQVRGYTALGRVLELETLQTGVMGKLALWRALREGADQLGLDRARLDRLVERAERQRDQLAGLHATAALVILGRRDDGTDEPNDRPDPVMTAQGAVEPAVETPDPVMTAHGAVQPAAETPNPVMTAQGAVEPASERPEPTMTAQGVVLPADDDHDDT